jgi:two-component system, NarL family, response regulator YdfI
VRPTVIAVAVLASSPKTRARLEALVAARSGWRLAAPPSPAAAQTGDPVGAAVSADVLLIEPGTRPVEAFLRALSGAARLPPIMLLGGGVAPAAFARLLRAGVRAILPRDASAHEIAAGIEALTAGLVVLHPAAPPVSIDTAVRHLPPEARADPLTPRELEILGMMAEGMGNRAIAKSLGISTHTVKFHIAAILDKLSARSRTEAVAIGMRRGLLMV